jgi:hypothetical protein
MILELPFCRPRLVDSFFCDIPLEIELTCMDTDSLGVVINADSGALAKKLLHSLADLLYLHPINCPPSL